MTTPIEMPTGTEVIVWCRPEQDLILLFGEGIYEGNNFVNGQLFPVVRLVDNSELTLHYTGVYLGRKDAVARTCQTFQGDVLQFDLQAFLRGVRPTPEQRKKRADANSSGPPKLPEAKTATDRLLNLKREIEYEDSKIKLAHKMIEDCQKTIQSKRAEMKSIRDAVLKELEIVDSVELPPTQTEEVKPTVEPVAATPVNHVSDPEDFDAIARQNAIED